MTTEASTQQHEGRYVRANGTDIFYVEAGTGEPLLLLHGGLVSTNPVWAGVPVTYVSHMNTFAQHFRVIAPDTRGQGRTVNAGGGSIPYTLLADDVLALINALGLDRPLICGFSEGGITATIAAIRDPDAVRAIVNDAGYDLLNPHAPTMTMTRQVFGGSPDATLADPEAAARFFEASDETRAMPALMQADHDSAQGPGHWKTVIAELFERGTQSPGYTVEDLRKVTVPTLIMTGDRDFLCSVEEGVAAYRTLPDGELAILPGISHVITPLKVHVSIDFLVRHATHQSGAASA
ncbi:MAG: alpha/beta fold hydrolase [Dehalococcoidia bacterium]